MKENIIDKLVDLIETKTGRRLIIKEEIDRNTIVQLTNSAIDSFEIFKTNFQQLLDNLNDISKYSNERLQLNSFKTRFDTIDKIFNNIIES